jgi:hypothetical protein
LCLSLCLLDVAERTLGKRPRMVLVAKLDWWTVA